jgi:O-acetylserine/cysteine efflux transporter
MTGPHILLAIAINVSWGLTFVFVKPALEHMPPLLIVGLRFAILAAMLLPFAGWPRGHFRELAVLGIVLGPIHMAPGYLGLSQVDASVTTMIMQLQVPFASLLAWLVWRERLGWPRAIGMAVAFAGIALIAGEPRTASAPWAIATLIVSALFFVVYSMLLKHYAVTNPMQLHGWASLFAAPPVLAMSLAFEDGQMTAIVSGAWQPWAAIAYSVVVITIITFSLWQWLLRRYAVNQTMPFLLIMPVTGVLGGYFILGEPMSVQRALGTAVTILGVALIARAGALTPQARAPT